MNCTLLITSKLTNQRARKALFACVVYILMTVILQMLNVIVAVEEEVFVPPLSTTVFVPGAFTKKEVNV